MTSIPTTASSSKTKLVNWRSNIRAKAYDAIQLASALRCRSGLTLMPDTQLVFVSADVHLLNIAQTEGLVTDNLNYYP